MTASELYFHIRSILKTAGVEDFGFEAMCIAEEVSGMKLQRLLLEKNPLDGGKVRAAEEIAARRITGEPLQYILGRWEFYGMPFYVGRGVLIPRPDTETLVDYAVEKAKKLESPVRFDLCSGSGCIAAAAAHCIPGAQVTAVELSDEAAEYLRRNIELNRVEVRLIVGDVLKRETAESAGSAQMILCNPPYLTSADMTELQREVAFEPAEALFGGKDGLDFYRTITHIWKDHLVPGGILAYEIGMGQENSVSEILSENGFEEIDFRNDLAGITRVVSGIKI